MEKYLRENFSVQPKNPSESALRRWRSAVSVVKNPRRRFRMVANLAQRAEAEHKRRKLQEKIRVALYVQKAALHFINAGNRRVVDGVDGGGKGGGVGGDTDGSYMLSKETREAGFEIEPDELASIVRSHDKKCLERYEGVGGVARVVRVSLQEGVISVDAEHRQNIYGCNRHAEKPPRSFWMFVWDAMQDLTLIILMACSFVSVGVGIVTEGWPKGMYDGVGIILSILLVVFVTSISDYKQSLQFKDLDKEKKNVSIQVTRDGRRQKVSIHDLVVGDIVHLSIGDVVPADGLLISGFGLLIDESSLSGESDAVNVDHRKPFLLAGTTVQDGSAKMLVTSVGVRTEWGRLMDTLNEGGDDETPLQVKLNGVATIIGKIGLGFALLTFIVLTSRFLWGKIVHHEITKWSLNDASELLNFFATAVIIIVVAVPEGLPLAVTLSLAFAMKKLMNDKALVRHLSACETMGSASCICTDKTGTLTTNHMVVDKIWICGQTKAIKSGNSENVLKSFISEQTFDLLLQSIFQNTGSEIVKGLDGKNKIMGTPTESALLEFGLLLGGDSKFYNDKYKIVKVEPFNSIRKKMSVLVALPGGPNKYRAFCKGASELVVEMCDKVVNADGKVVNSNEQQKSSITEVINGFASEALRTLCIAYKDTEGSSERDRIPEDKYTLIAIVGIKDPVRPGVKEAVKTCLEAGIMVRMVTGDNINTAKAIARECGIFTDGIAIEGPDFRNKSQQELEKIIPKIQVMARSLPLDKHKLVTHLREDFNEVVAVTGDGTNDAPALHEADIGLAMGIAGTEVAKENADVIVMDDNFSTIVKVTRWGRAVYINIQKFVQFQLTVNVVALMLNFVSACVSGSAPLSAVQMLWVNMIMDTLGALALATEPPHDGLMKRPPIGKNSKFITRVMWRNIIGQSIYQIIVLLLLKFRGKKILMLDEHDDTTLLLNTVIFNSFVFCQVFNEINSRDMEKINVFEGMLSSWVFLIVMGITICAQVMIVECLGAFAQTVPLSRELWLASVMIGAVSLVIAVVIKCIPVPSSTYVATHHDGYEQLPTGPELA
ncbi:putative calcium-transporting ATPase 11, plasma membrane-type [Vigna unguiculata]|uniref:putative calcium-transporting ATPase 11, plasma membrane-type n=1 Tax=Vigna unguiculata TaxID=3917 RepID=UPI0010161DF7|nr:putative calcium-transporting ATPase 11, plasma membrane-type [Vigna unguiculata]